jgi:hypothetical protein
LAAMAAGSAVDGRPAAESIRTARVIKAAYHSSRAVSAGW